MSNQNLSQDSVLFAAVFANTGLRNRENINQCFCWHTLSGFQQLSGDCRNIKTYEVYKSFPSTVQAETLYL